MKKTKKYPVDRLHIPDEHLDAMTEAYPDGVDMKPIGIKIWLVAFIQLALAAALYRWPEALNVCKVYLWAWVLPMSTLVAVAGMGINNGGGTYSPSSNRILLRRPTLGAISNSGALALLIILAAMGHVWMSASVVVAEMLCRFGLSLWREAAVEYLLPKEDPEEEGDSESDA